jgi:branched-chain amino acid transport system substrate-binding protein
VSQAPPRLGNGRNDELKTNRVSVLAATAMLALGLTACGVLGTAADDSPVIIGADLELTGPFAAVGKVYQNALQLEIAQINASGGAGGHPVQLVVRDNHSDPQTATSDIASLTSQEGVAAIVTGACGDCLAAVMKTLNTKKIPTISLAPADLAALTTSGTPTTGSDSYLFKINPNAEDNAAALTAQLASDSDVHKYAILTMNDTYGRTLAANVRSDASKSQVEPIASEQVAASADENALRQAVHSAVSQSPRALIVSLLPTQATQVVQLAREEDYQRPIYFDAIAAGSLFLPTSEQVMSGVTMVAPQSLVIDDTIATSPAQTARRQWFAAYTSKYGGFSAYSLYAADAARVISSAIASAGSTDNDQLRNAIEATQVEGLSGALRFTPDDHSGLTAQALANVNVTDDNRWHLANG